MAIVKSHNTAKLQLYTTPLTTLSYYTFTTTPGTSAISFRASQGKLTDFQFHSRRNDAFRQIQAEQPSFTTKRMPGNRELLQLYTKITTERIAGVTSTSVLSSRLKDHPTGGPSESATTMQHSLIDTVSASRS